MNMSYENMGFVKERDVLKSIQHVSFYNGGHV